MQQLRKNTVSSQSCFKSLLVSPALIRLGLSILTVVGLLIRRINSCLLAHANSILLTIAFLHNHFVAGTNSQAMFLISQPNLLANKRRKFVLSSQISKESNTSVSFQWAPFPVEMTGVSSIVPSPSGVKLFVVRNPENDSPTQIEIWGPSQLEKEFHIPQSIHGSIYTDGW